MTQRITTDFFIRRTGWNGLVPTRDRSGLWPQVRWLCWTADIFPLPVSDSLGRQVDDMRGGDQFASCQEQIAGPKMLVIAGAVAICTAVVIAWVLG